MWRRAMITLEIERWLHAPPDFSLERVRGRVVLLHTFQLLCPGCVLHAIPQIQRIEALALPEIAVVGLHTVFEHHAAMTAVVLEAFLDEYHIRHPVGIDAHRPGQNVPATMAALRLRGTPTLLLLDRAGRERHRWFGAVTDLEIGVRLGRILAEKPGTSSTCTEDGCPAPIEPEHPRP